MSRAPLLALLALLGAALAGCASDTAPEAMEDIAFATVAAGPAATCGTALDGRLFCWGSGIGSGPQGAAALRPRALGRGRFADVSLAEDHACAVATSGEVYCWGENTNHQLGGAARERTSLPAPVPAATSAIAVATGLHHSCALQPDGQARCWGWGIAGQLGFGQPTDLGFPEPVPGYVFQAISAGDEYTCGITPEVRAYCWGLDDRGQLGALGPDVCPLHRMDRPCALRPVAVDGDHAFTVISAGARHACALDTDGRVWCWGEGTMGQLGDGALANAPAPVAVAGDLRFQAIAAGARHTCALDDAGRAWCWGHNEFGRLGDTDHFGPVPTPIPVMTELRFTAISAGPLHTCAIADDRRLYCWGFGGFGQLGTGEPISHATPIPVAPSSG